METLGSRLKTLRRNKKITQQVLADAVGVSKTSVIYWEKDENIPKHDSLIALAKTLDTTTEYILTGKRQPLEENQPNIIPVAPKMAPVLSWVQAGVFTNVQAVDMSQVEEWLPLPDDCEDCFYLKVQGMSNYPTFQEGDYILVDPLVQYCDMRSGDVIVVRKHDDATFKKLVIETDGTKYLQALNPDFKPNIIPLDEDCLFVGEVIDSVRYVYRSKRRNKMKNGQ
jgi:SOS-response transcriptional repressor LexA